MSYDNLKIYFSKKPTKNGINKHNKLDWFETKKDEFNANLKKYTPGYCLKLCYEKNIDLFGNKYFFSVIDILTSPGFSLNNGFCYLVDRIYIIGNLAIHIDCYVENKKILNTSLESAIINNIERPIVDKFKVNFYFVKKTNDSKYQFFDFFDFFSSSKILKLKILNEEYFEKINIFLDYYRMLFYQLNENFSFSEIKNEYGIFLEEKFLSMVLKHFLIINLEHERYKLFEKDAMLLIENIEKNKIK
jgi:hypothetical protein